MTSLACLAACFSYVSTAAAEGPVPPSGIYMPMGLT